MGADDSAPPGGRPARLRDVAAAAGVSRTTASDTLNDRGRVAPATRRKILAAAERLGYRANLHAQALRRGRSGILGVLSSLDEDAVDLTGDEYVIEYLAGSTTLALSSGYSVVLLPPSNDRGQTRDIAADGFLLLDPIAASPLFDELEARGVPVVSTGRVPDLPKERASWVDNDLRAETRKALDLMHAGGATRIALVTNPPTRSYVIDTIDAYREWTAKRGLEPRIAFTEGSAGETAGFAAAASLLDGSDPPDAIYAPVDRLASGALLAARLRGIAVPADLQIVAGNDSPAARSADPPLTAVDNQARVLGRKAVELLIARVEDPTLAHSQIVIPAVLHERGSTRSDAKR
ncbi:MAG: LacI family DNA-binding transcriptional regulator [Actinobacteria bacterium]|nr:LacI family DNA-binding transcriptional regulator [Actinomycetota bacterium]